MSLLVVLLTLVLLPASAHAFPISSAAWSSSDWEQHCKDVRTTFNRDRPVATDRLTLTTTDDSGNALSVSRWKKTPETGLVPASPLETSHPVLKTQRDLTSSSVV